MLKFFKKRILMFFVIILVVGKGICMCFSLFKILYIICGEFMLFYILEMVFLISDDVYFILYY